MPVHPQIAAAAGKCFYSTAQHNSIYPAVPLLSPYLIYLEENYVLVSIKKYVC
jgi:hypothetical protein